MGLFALAMLLASMHVNYATFVGGSGDEHAAAIAVDAAGSAYLVGTTNSPDFPLTSTTFGAPASSKACTFVTKLNAGGNGIVWSVCLAGGAPNGVAVDAGGNVYVLTGDSVTKLSAAGDRIVYSRALGATAAGIAVDAAGNVYVAGVAGTGLATTASAYQPELAPGMCKTSTFLQAPPTPCSDAFAMKLAADGSVAWATYLGGSGPDQANAIAVDAQGNAWVTGQTVSPNFPVTAGAAKSTFGGEIDLGPLQYGDAFVTRFDTSGKLLYSTYLGGAAPDAGRSIAVDAAGSAYVAGWTQSAEFPTTVGVLQRVFPGVYFLPATGAAGFLVKFNAAGAIAYSTFLSDGIATLAVDAQGRAYFAPLAVLSADASAIANSAGVSGWLAVDGQGSVYLAGGTMGPLFFPSVGAAQGKFGGGTYDSTVMKVNFTQTASPWIASIVNAASMRTGTPQNYPVYDLAPGEIISIFGSGFDASTRVFFDGLEAPILYAGSSRINAVVPFGVNPPATAITLQGAGQSFGPSVETVLDAVPAIFTADGSGRGQAAILNEDGSVNSAANPAAAGSVISVFMTGAGKTIPGAACNLGQVTYTGAAPGLVAGAVQVNVRLGSTVADRVPIVIYIGNYASGFLGDTTVAVRQ